MRRLPNLWFLIPAVFAAVVGAFVGRTVARVMCTIEPTQFETGVRGCVGLEVGLAILVAIIAFAGVAVVLTLSFRSLAEWNDLREATDKDTETETPVAEDSTD